MIISPFRISKILPLNNSIIVLIIESITWQLPWPEIFNDFFSTFIRINFRKTRNYPLNLSCSRN